MFLRVFYFNVYAKVIAMRISNPIVVSSNVLDKFDARFVNHGGLVLLLLWIQLVY